jgi:hypothetical protein
MNIVKAGDDVRGKTKLILSQKRVALQGAVCYCA